MIVSDFTALADNLGDLSKNYELDINRYAPIDRDDGSDALAEFAFVLLLEIGATSELLANAQLDLAARHCCAMSADKVLRQRRLAFG